MDAARAIDAIDEIMLSDIDRLRDWLRKRMEI
jgi:hypothetical protein